MHEEAIYNSALLGQLETEIMRTDRAMFEQQPHALQSCSRGAQDQVHTAVREHWLAQLPDLQRIRRILKRLLHLARPGKAWGEGKDTRRREQLGLMCP